MALNTHFDEILKFPCTMKFKVMGVAKPEMIEDVIAEVQKHAPGDYSPRVTPSSKGNYQALSIPVIVTSKEHIETIYTSLNKLELVRYIL